MKLVAWLSSVLAALDGSSGAPAHPVPGRNPVVLVHGIYSSSADMTRMAETLRQQGWEVFTPDITPADGRVSLDQLAAQLAAYTAAKMPGRRFDLVGFSMGGL